MKNKFIILILLLLINSSLFAENILIEAKNISLDKDKKTSIFEDNVTITTKKKIIKSEYVEHDKIKGQLIIKKNVVAQDEKNNVVKTQHAEYFEKEGLFKSIGATSIITSEKYIINGEDIIIDNSLRIISSKKSSTIEDLDGNQIYLENFEYQIDKNIFKSIGLIKIKDQNDNQYEFAQIYIDTKKKEILGSDIKSFLNSNEFKYSEDNKPRIFANTLKVSKNKSKFKKGIFTICDYRENDKCPPWTIQASEILHDSKKKTVYYDNAIIKVYNIPIFYIPKLSHPDPTVERRSGFLTPSISNSKNLGSGITIPYFFAINKDKNFTLRSRLYGDENHLFSGEYHQAFKNSNLLTDFGYTKGYKKISSAKKAGDKSHFFSKYIKNFKGKNNSDNTLDLSLQSVSNDKYLKLYKIKSNLVDYNKDTLESSLEFTHQNEDLYLNFNASMYETLKESYNDKYEYILPEVTLEKNLLSNDTLGVLNLESNLKFHNYDTNKSKKILINDLDWTSNSKSYENGINSYLLGNFKNLNYETKNISPFKEDTTSEFYGAIGLLSELNLFKNNSNSKHFLKPKMLIRFAPGSMRKHDGGQVLTPTNAFSMNRLENADNFETGLTSTIGFDYKVQNNKKEFDFSVAQIINEKENKKMSSKTSLDEKLSDLVASSSLKLNDNIRINYNFAVDQNYNEFNYNEIGTKMNFGLINFNFDYLEERKHVGNQEYFKTKIEFNNPNNSQFSIETKRNLVTNSAEFYNLSYEYLNDCLRAGLVYRREFYNDSELEPENSLLFKITLVPFGNINSPTFSK
jgi:LPS-assembly protein